MSTLNENTLFVINGFYMSMREKYTAPGKSIHYYTVEWDPKTLAWKDFREKVLGGTDPATAPEGSLRNTILKTYKELDLKTVPTIGDNGVHASASPFEAMCERLNWIAQPMEADLFAKELLKAGMKKEDISAWSKDPQVKYKDGSMGSLFDALEDMDVDQCMTEAKALAGKGSWWPQGLKGPTGLLNQAFVFIKPHAVTDKVKKLVEARFEKEGIKITSQGDLTAEKISNDKLIDNHYYAIANKASLTKPKDLNPPEKKKADFKAKWGLTWDEALANGRVFNSVDACTKMGCSGSELNTIWAKAKKNKLLLKFGGGFYAGEVDPADLNQGSIMSTALVVAGLAAVVALSYFAFSKSASGSKSKKQ